MMPTPFESPNSMTEGRDNDMNDVRSNSMNDVSFMLNAQCRVSTDLESKSSSPVDSISATTLAFDTWKSSFESLPPTSATSERKRVLAPATNDTARRRKRSCSQSSSIAKTLLTAEHVQKRSFSENDAKDYEQEQFELSEESESLLDTARAARKDDDFFGMSHDEFLAEMNPNQQQDNAIEGDDSVLDSLDFTSVWALSAIDGGAQTTTAAEVPQPDSNIVEATAMLQSGTDTLAAEQVSTSHNNTSSSIVARSNHSNVTSSSSDSQPPLFSPSDSLDRIYIAESSVTDLDVLCGREFSASDHVGNLAYLHTVATKKPLYHSYGSHHREKTKIRNAIVDTIANKGGRFVAKSVDGRFYLQTIEEARFKVSQCLREKRNNKKKKSSS